MSPSECFLDVHLAVDAVEVLLAARHAGLHAGVVQGLVEPLRDPLQELPLVALGAAHRLVQHPVAERVGVAEAQVLQLRLDRVDPEAVGDGRVDLERFPGDALLLVGGHGVQRLHVVQAVGELEQDHADVLHHRQHHLAEALHLQLGAAAEVQLLELADAVHEGRDLGAEARGDFVLGGRGVLDDVVHQRRGDALVVEVQVRQDSGDGHRVGDVGVAGAALLAFVGVGAEGVGIGDDAELLLGQVPDLVQQAAEPAVAAGQGQAIQDGRRVIHGPILALPAAAGGRPESTSGAGLRRCGGDQSVRSSSRRSSWIGRVQQGLGLFAGHQVFRRLVGFVQHVPGDEAGGDFPQGDDRGLVVLPVQQRLGAVGHAAGALGGHHDQLEQVRDVLQAVFDGDAGHGAGLSVMCWGARL